MRVGSPFPIAGVKVPQNEDRLVSRVGECIIIALCYSLHYCFVIWTRHVCKDDVDLSKIPLKTIGSKRYSQYLIVRRAFEAMFPCDTQDCSVLAKVHQAEDAPNHNDPNHTITQYSTFWEMQNKIYRGKIIEIVSLSKYFWN